MRVGKLVRFVSLFVVGLSSTAADRATAQVNIVSGSTSIAQSGFTVGPFGPWGSSYGGFTASFGGYGGYGGSYYGSGVWTGYPGGGYFADYWGVPYWDGPWGGGYVLPPLVIPAETLYGPGPVRRMMGLDPPLGTPIVNNTVINLPSQAQGFGVVAPGAATPAVPGVRTSNAQARDLAKRQIAGGDTLFAKQQYAQALDLYKQASRSAPDVADSHFRQMVALVALGRFEAAVDAVKAGMRISKSTLNGEFKIPAVYGDNVLAHAAHLDALAKAATDRPTSDLFFLTGVMLFFDNPPQRSAPFFEKAAELVVGERWHIDVFRQVLQKMPAPVAAEAPPAAPARNVAPRLPPADPDEPREI